ncbi:MAG: GNAT family N-acetyltransferase [Candidatus Bathyarchaeia archaeon]
MSKHHVRVYYYPQCPWIVPTINSIVEAVGRLGYECSIYNLLSEKLDVRALFKVYVDDRVVPIGIGMTDVGEVTNCLLGCCGGSHEQESSENTFSYSSKSEVVGKIRIDSITIDDMDDEIELCVGEDFLYGAIPQNFLKEAREMKRGWLRHIISEFEACGYIAYSEKEPVGFIEFIPGDFAEDLGIKTYHSPKQTMALLCLSVKKAYWGKKIGSKLLSKLKKDLSTTNYRYIEVTAYKSGVWHPAAFYIKNNFKIVKKFGNNLQMAYQV